MSAASPHHASQRTESIARVLDTESAVRVSPAVHHRPCGSCSALSDAFERTVEKVGGMNMRSIYNERKRNYS